MRYAIIAVLVCFWLAPAQAHDIRQLPMYGQEVYEISHYALDEKIYLQSVKLPGRKCTIVFTQSGDINGMDCEPLPEPGTLAALWHAPASDVIGFVQSLFRLLGALVEVPKVDN